MPVYIDMDMDYFVKPIFKDSVNGIRLYKDEFCQLGDANSFFDVLMKKVNIPDEKHMFTNHKKSYIYWWMKGLRDCTVIHIDAHSDLYRNKQKDLRLINDIDMNCDDYLWYALREEFISEIYWVCPEILFENGRMDTVKGTISPSMISRMEIQDRILNIDFSIISRAGANRNIKLHILRIEDLPFFQNDAVLLTMATSPEFIPSCADKLIDIVNSYINFNAENLQYVKKQHKLLLNVSREDLDNARKLLQA